MVDPHDWRRRRWVQRVLWYLWLWLCAPSTRKGSAFGLKECIFLQRFAPAPEMIYNLPLIFVSSSFHLGSTRSPKSPCLWCFVQVLAWIIACCPCCIIYSRSHLKFKHILFQSRNCGTSWANVRILAQQCIRRCIQVSLHLVKLVRSILFIIITSKARLYQIRSTEVVS